jgi:hypothetical protein
VNLEALVATLKTFRPKLKGKGGKKPRPVPLVILGLDEAHSLTRRQSSSGVEWSVFFEFRHTLRALQNLPVFSIFLSTTGKISQFASANWNDLSARVINGELILIQPFTDLGFDTLAVVISLDGTWKLEALAHDSHIAYLGRPLCVLL